MDVAVEETRAGQGQKERLADGCGETLVSAPCVQLERPRGLRVKRYLSALSELAVADGDDSFFVVDRSPV